MALHIPKPTGPGPGHSFPATLALIPDEKARPPSSPVAAAAAVPLADAAAAAAETRPVWQSNFDRFAAEKHPYMDRYAAIRHLPTQIYYAENKDKFLPGDIFEKLKTLIGDRNDISIDFIHEYEDLRLPDDIIKSRMVRWPNFVVKISCLEERMNDSFITEIVIGFYFEQISVEFKFSDSDKVHDFRRDQLLSGFTMSMLDKYLPKLPRNQPVKELIDQYLYIVGSPDLQRHPFGSPDHQGSDTFLKNLIVEQDGIFGREAIRILSDQIAIETGKPNNELLVQELKDKLQVIQTRGFRGSQAHREKLIEEALDSLPCAYIQSVIDLSQELTKVFSDIPALSFNLNEDESNLCIKYNEDVIVELDHLCALYETEKGQGPKEYVLQRLWIRGIADIQGRLPSDPEHRGCPDWILAQNRRMALSNIENGATDTGSADDSEKRNHRELVDFVRKIPRLIKLNLDEKKG